MKVTIESLPNFAGVPVRLRKRPFFSADHGDRYPLVVVSPAKEEIAKLHMKAGMWVDYDVLVCLIQGQGATLQKESELIWQTDRREELRQALFKGSGVLAGASSVFDSSYDPTPAYDLGGLDRLHDVSTQLFRFRSNEVRGQ